MNRYSLRRRIVAPLGIALGAMLASFLGLFYFSQRRQIDESRARDQVSVERYFSSKLARDADLMGGEIGQIAQEAKRVLGVELFVFVRKNLVDRASWDAGMRRSAPQLSWHSFPSDVLVHHTTAVPAELIDHFKERSAGDQFVDARLDGKRLLGSALPLRDVTDAQIGEIVFLRDYTALMRATFRTFLVSALIALLVGFACMVLLYERVRHFFIAPLLELRSVAERAGKGELSLVATEHRPDELGDLAVSLNRMILDLRSAQAEQTRMVLDAALDAVATFDQHGQVIDWNRQAEALFGWSRGDAIGKSVFDLMRRSSTRPAIEKALESYRDSGTSGLFNRLLEETVQRRDGSLIAVEMAIAPVHAASGLFFSAFIRDISDRKRLEEDLQAAQRLEAIGKLAGGIAHDFNNLITAIVGYVTSVQETLIPGTQPYDDANEIHRAADRATGLVQQLLAFARKRVVQPRIVDVNELVTRTDRMLRRLIGENIQLEVTLDRGLWPVLADPGQLEQVLVNLAVNARDAMPNNGRVQIQTANVVISGAVSVDGAVPPGYYAMFVVSDTGEGMDDATLAHIFEPFFTTKPQGQGTGLGLATCYGIVKQAGGYIRVSSSKGRGSTFRIYLPRADAAPRAEPVVVKRVPGVNRNETILLVEDEHQVRRLIERALKQQGYTIIAATNGVEAIRASLEYAQPIHLLLTDVVMPEMGGREAAAVIRAQRGDIRVIYMSGYSEELVRLQGELTESAAFIAKPFAPDELRRVVRDVLDAVPA